MTTIRRRNILSLVKDIQLNNEDMTFMDSFFALHSSKEITTQELDYLIDWMTD